MYIVTGGAGFIGSAMVWKLNQMGIDDIIVLTELVQAQGSDMLTMLTGDFAR